MKGINSSIVESKFKRSKLNLNKTKLWNMLTIEQKKYIINNTKLIDSDQNIICYYPNDKYWWLITNNHLVISDNEKILFINLFDISKIEIVSNIKYIDSKETSIYIFFNNIQVELHLEKNSWTIIIEILKFITSSNFNIISRHNL